MQHFVLAALGSVLKPLKHLSKVYLTNHRQKQAQCFKTSYGPSIPPPPKFSIHRHMIYRRHHKLKAQECNYTKQTNK